MAVESLPEELIVMRKQLDALDERLVSLLAERFEVTRRLGGLKAKHQLNAVDAQREQQKLAEISRLCAAFGLVEGDAIKEIFKTIMREVVKKHRQVGK